MGFSIFDERVLVTSQYSWDDSFTPGFVTYFDAGAYGTRVDNLIVSNTDTIDHIVDIAIWNGGNPAGLGSVLIPAGTGYGGLPAIDILPSLAGASMDGILISRTFSLAINVEEVLNAGKFVTFVAFRGDF